MRRISNTDRLAAVLIFTFLFTLGFHLGKRDVQTVNREFTLTVLPTRSWGEPFSDGELNIDGKYPVALISGDAEEARLLVTAVAHPSGYLIGGAKSLSPNQPVRIYRDGCGFEGRILSIEPA